MWAVPLDPEPLPCSLWAEEEGAGAEASRPSLSRPRFSLDVLTWTPHSSPQPLAHAIPVRRQCL